MDESMDEQQAMQTIVAHKDRLVSEVAAAVDFLYEKHRKYQNIANAIEQSLGKKVSTVFLRSRRVINSLPKGIRWQVDSGKIKIGHCAQIAKIASEDDQWLLAYVITSEDKLSKDECNKVATAVAKGDMSMREALQKFAGIRCNSEIAMVLPLDFDSQLAIAKRGWSWAYVRNNEDDKGMTISDFCWQLIRQGTKLDYAGMASVLTSMATELDAVSKKPDPEQRNQTNNAKDATGL